MIFIIGILYLFAAYLSVFRPPLYLVLFGIIGSMFDAFGVGNYFSSIVTSHFTIMYLLFFVAVISSLIKYIQDATKEYLYIIKILLLFSITMAVSIVVYYLSNPLVTISLPQMFMNIIYLLINFSFLGVVILLIHHKNYDIKKLLLLFLSIQIVIAFFVIYLPNFGINVLNVIDGTTYQAKSVYSSSKGATPFNFYEVLSNKYYFNKFAQFHNSNDTGFYFGVGLFFSVNKIYTSPIGKKYIFVILSFLLIVLWSNSGMRAPIVGVILSIIINFFLVKLTLKRVTIFVLTLPVVLAIFFIPTVQKILAFSLGVSQESKISYTSRASLMETSLAFFKKNIFTGNGGRLEELSSIGVSPHFLPLKLAVMFGVFTAVMLIICLYVLPTVNIVRHRKNMMQYGLLIIIWLVSITDNYTCIVLFNFILAFVLSKNKGVKNENINIIRL